MVDGVCTSTSWMPRARSSGNIAVSFAQTPVVRAVGPARKPSSPVYGV